jgi:hypothetical protein
MDNINALDDRNFEMSCFDQTPGVHNSMVQFACGLDNKSEEVSHEYLYDPVCGSVGGVAIRSWCFSRSGWVYSHPAHRRCNFADYALCARQDYSIAEKSPRN